MASERDDGRRRIVAPRVGDATGTKNWFLLIPIWLASATIQGALLGVFFLIASFAGPVQAGRDKPKQEVVQLDTKIEDDGPQPDLTNTDLGSKSELPLNYKNDNIANISVPGEVNKMESPGIKDGQ